MVWGATIQPSRSDLVLVEQSAEPIFSPDLARRRPRRGERGERRLRSLETKSAVWPVGVVVVDVLGHYPFEPAAAHVKDPVQTSPPQ